MSALRAALRGAIFFLVAAVGLLLVAVLRRPPPANPDEGAFPSTSQELHQRELELLAKKDYGATENAVKAEEVPFLITPPDTDVLVEKLSPVCK